MKEFGELFSPNDPKLVTQTLARLQEQDKWNDVFSTKLIELLDKIDQIKSEIREHQRKADERIEWAESVTQAEIALLKKCDDFGELAEQLKLAKAAEQTATQLAVNAKQHLDAAQAAHEQASAKLRVAKEHADSACLLSTRSLFQAARIARFAIYGVALSWLAMLWVVPLMTHTATALWTSACLSVVIVIAAVLLARGSNSAARTS